MTKTEFADFVSTSEQSPYLVIEELIQIHQVSLWQDIFTAKSQKVPLFPTSLNVKNLKITQGFSIWDVP